MDTFVTLYNRLLNRCPSIGPVLAQQFINDSWRTLQARKIWGWRRRAITIAPPNIYQTGTVTIVASTNPYLVTGTGTVWTAAMVGRQIRVYGLLYPYYTITAVIDGTHLMLDQAWAGDDVTTSTYQILQVYYSMPQDFGYLYAVVSLKDAFQLFTNMTEADLAMLDPQRTNFGQSWAMAFRDYTPQYAGSIGPVIPVTSPTDPGPVSTTTSGFTYPANATYIVQVTKAGVSGVAEYKWMRAGQAAFSLAQLTANFAVDLADGVQIYWPDGVTYVINDLFVINCTSVVGSGTARYELWPAPTFSGYLYPALYIAKESDLTVAQPQLPPPIASRGEILLEMALAKCATFPGSEVNNPNPYYNLNLSKMHDSKVAEMLIDLERNDEETGITEETYQNYPFYPAPWLTGKWMQSHAPFLNG